MLTLQVSTIVSIRSVWSGGLVWTWNALKRRRMAWNDGGKRDRNMGKDEIIRKGWNHARWEGDEHETVNCFMRLRRQDGVSISISRRS
jgi:hypothetical protein